MTDPYFEGDWSPDESYLRMGVGKQYARAIYFAFAITYGNDLSESPALFSSRRRPHPTCSPWIAEGRRLTLRSTRLKKESDISAEASRDPFFFF